jgi:hypothetical protein
MRMLGVIGIIRAFFALSFGVHGTTSSDLGGSLD